VIELPTPCAGDLSGTEQIPCQLEAEVAVWGPVEAADGSPVFGFMAVCPRHVKGALRMMRMATPIPDAIETWRLATFVEHSGMIVRSLGAPLEQLRAVRAA
jgi:hypothetical protein